MSNPMRSFVLSLALVLLTACGATPEAVRDEPQAPAEPTPTGPSEPTEPAERSCGGMVAGQAGCGEGEFCDFPIAAICGAADGTGVCRTIPTACTMDFRPVCGCDERTYPNACAAASHGVSVASEGECAPRVAAAGETCGTRGALPCGEGLFCDFPAGANCGRADAPGTCAPIPTECDTRAARVCGCDGTTYANECSAHRAGVSVEARGACRASSSGR